MDVLRLFGWLLRTLGLLVAIVFGWLYRLSRWGLLKIGRSLTRKKPSTFGTARWAGLMDVLFAKPRAWGGSKGVILGKAWGRLLRFTGDGAVLVYAPQGAGKGVQVVIPTCLTWQGSALILDPKAENFDVTHAHRKTFSKIIRLDAIEPKRSDSFNPLDTIRPDPDFMGEDAAALAEMLVEETGGTNHDNYFTRAARTLVRAFLLYVSEKYRTQPELRTLATVRKFLTYPEGALKEELETMAQFPVAAVAEEATSVQAAIDNESARDVIRTAAEALALFSEGTLGARLTGLSTFSFEDLVTDNVTIYVMVPETRLDVLRPLLRVMFGCALTALTLAKERGLPAQRPLIMIDEAKALGRLDVLSRSMGWLRAYAQLVLIWQDLGQLYATYGEHTATTFKANSGATVAFNVNDLTTAKELADIIGQRTVFGSSAGMSQGSTEVFRHQQQAGQSEAGYYLADPAQIIQMTKRYAVVRTNTIERPLRIKKWDYRRDQTLRQAAGVWRARQSASGQTAAADPAVNPARDAAEALARPIMHAKVRLPAELLRPVDPGASSHDDASR